MIALTRLAQIQAQRASPRVSLTHFRTQGIAHVPRKAH